MRVFSITKDQDADTYTDGRGALLGHVSGGWFGDGEQAMLGREVKVCVPWHNVYLQGLMHTLTQNQWNREDQLTRLGFLDFRHGGGGEKRFISVESSSSDFVFSLHTQVASFRVNVPIALPIMIVSSNAIKSHQFQRRASAPTRKGSDILNSHHQHRPPI